MPPQALLEGRIETYPPVVPFDTIVALFVPSLISFCPVETDPFTDHPAGTEYSYSVMVP